MRTRATRVSPLRPTIASIALAVPSIARVTRAGSTSRCPTARLIAVPMPLRTSAVLETLAFATKRWRVSMTTASVGLAGVDAEPQVSAAHR